MSKKAFLIGFLIGIVTSFIGAILFVLLFIDTQLTASFQILKSNGYLGKIIALGAILNLITFWILIKSNKETMAKGVIGAVILLALLTLFI